MDYLPCEENFYVDEISNLLILNDGSFSRAFFLMLDAKCGPHFSDLFSTNETSFPLKTLFNSLVHVTSGVIAFDF